MFPWHCWKDKTEQCLKWGSERKTLKYPLLAVLFASAASAFAAAF